MLFSSLLWITFTCIHVTPGRFWHHFIYDARPASKAGRFRFYLFFFSCLQVLIKLCQTSILHLEVLYATISLHTFLNKIKNTPAHFQEYLAVGRRAMTYYLNIVIKQSFKITVGCLLALQLHRFTWTPYKTMKKNFKWNPSSFEVPGKKLKFHIQRCKAW